MPTDIDRFLMLAVLFTIVTVALYGIAVLVLRSHTMVATILQWAAGTFTGPLAELTLNQYLNIRFQREGYENIKHLRNYLLQCAHPTTTGAQFH